MLSKIDPSSGRDQFTGKQFLFVFPLSLEFGGCLFRCVIFRHDVDFFSHPFLQ